MHRNGAGDNIYRPSSMNTPKTCPACLGQGVRVANAGTGLLTPCPAKSCSAKAKADAQTTTNATRETQPTQAQDAAQV
jgi:hypothetical protein